MRRSFQIWLVLAAFLFILSGGATYGIDAVSEAKCLEDCLCPVCAPCPANGVRELHLYSLVDGEVRDKVFTRADLLSGRGLAVDGSVCGVVAFCNYDMGIRIEGHEPEAVRWNAIAANSYSLFPDVVGDSLSPQSEFNIRFEAEGQTFETSIKHEAPCLIDDMGSNQEYSSGDLDFRYLGTRLDYHERVLPDFEARLKAIAEGIGLIESVFATDLIDEVNLVDMEGIRDAVACDKREEIWFYSDAFMQEPSAELKTMAKHESLHVFVDRNGITRDSEIRDLFATLKGYDMFSRERFHIVATGISPADASESDVEDSVFFSFIDEKNFYNGMKGGHSASNLHEFCVSLIHSLISIDRLEENLSRHTESSQLLTEQQKQEILATYVDAIEILIQSLPESHASSQWKLFLEQKLQTVKAVSEKLRLET